MISAVSSVQVVPRLTFYQLGSVATSADALSPLGRVRAKPEPEPEPDFRVEFRVLFFLVDSTKWCMPTIAKQANKSTIANLNDARDEDGSFLEQICDCTAYWHDPFTPNYHCQLGHALRHAQFHLQISINQSINQSIYLT